MTLSEGGSGQVWRALDTALQRPVAVKITTLECVGEARRVPQLQHHGIVAVHDVGQEAGHCFIVLDLVCAEGLFWQCHRRLVSDFLQANGVTVQHIMPSGELIENGSENYPGEKSLFT